MEHRNLQPSPYFGAEDPDAPFKARLLSHLEMLAIPRPRRVGKGECNRDCHIIERNHTLDLVKQFIRDSN